jgi:hypothetical protein
LGVVEHGELLSQRQVLCRGHQARKEEGADKGEADAEAVRYKVVQLTIAAAASSRGGTSVPDFELGPLKRGW